MKRHASLSLVAVYVLSAALASNAQPVKTNVRRPMIFEANAGQTDAGVKYLARGPGYTMFVTADEAVLRFSPESGGEQTLRLSWLNARPASKIAGVDPLPGRVNYLRGSEATKWISGVPTYAGVRLTGVYPGIDLVFHGQSGTLEYDFVVAPGGDPGQIAVNFSGQVAARLDARGDLILRTPHGELRQHQPIAFQTVGGKRRAVRSGFVLAGNIAHFELGAYDRSQPLIIDPVLSYSTYLGGDGDDFGGAIAVDAYGRAYVTGWTTAPDFPVKGAIQPSLKGPQDVFITKLWATGGGLIYSTYIGGSDTELGTAIAVDRFGNAYVAGVTYSTDFPVTSGAFQLTRMGFADGFVLKLNASGTALVYSTYLGGSSYDDLEAIALDSQGRAYVAGISSSLDYPLAAPADASSSSDEAVVTRLNASGSALQYSTFLGGTGRDYGQGIAVDSSFRAYITGSTESIDFPTTAGAYRRSFQGGSGSRGDPSLDAFVTRLSPDGSSFSYSTYLGGSGNEEGLDIAVDNQNRAYVTGGTGSTNFPTTAGAYRRVLGGGSDAFVTKLWATGGGLIYSTLLGGSSYDVGRSIAVDSEYRAWVTGETESSNFPTKNAFHAYRGNGDAFVTKFWATGGGVLFSTYLGAEERDQGIALRLDGNGNGYVTGRTTSTINFPTTSGAYRRRAVFGGEAFVTKIQP